MNIEITPEEIAALVRLIQERVSNEKIDKATQDKVTKIFADIVNISNFNQKNKR